MRDAGLPITLIVIGSAWLLWYFRLFPEAGTPQFIFLRSTRQTAPTDTALSECIPYIPADSCAGIFPHPEAAI
jgi:hypothetical protein